MGRRLVLFLCWRGKQNEEAETISTHTKIIQVNYITYLELERNGCIVNEDRSKDSLCDPLW
jgi:hypothetical protein